MKFRGLTSFWILLKATPTVLHSTANIKAGTITSTIDTIANFKIFLCRDVLGSCGGAAQQLSALSQGGIPADGASQLQEHRPATGAEAARASFFFFRVW